MNLAAEGSSFETKPNFRQAGVRQGGRLFIGSAHSHHATHALPAFQNTHATGQSSGLGRPTTSQSIPTKFETVLYHGDGESDGFGTRTTRFKHEIKDIPGPGHYETKKLKKKQSFNKKGKKNSAGLSFSSRDKRFRQILPGNGAVVIGGYLNPGPARYRAVDFIEQRSRNDFSTTVSSGFQQRQHYSKSQGESVSFHVPGPNYYHPEKAELYQKQRRNRKDRGHSGAVRAARAAALDGRIVTSGSTFAGRPSQVKWRSVKPEQEGKLRLVSGGVGHSERILERREVTARVYDDAARRRALVVDQPFLSTATRFSPLKPSKTPAPGSYELNNAFKTTKSNIAITGPFKSRTIRAGVPTDFPTDNPPPGEYDHANYANKFGMDTEPSANFITSSTTRFGEITDKRVNRMIVPGPGYYDDHTLGGKEVMKNQIKGYTMGDLSTRTVPVTNMFPGSCIPPPQLMRKYNEVIRSGLNATKKFKKQSQVNNIPASRVKPPGPSYYKPEEGHRMLLDRTNFHLNQTSKWI